MSSTCTPGTTRPDDGVGHRQPVVGPRVERPAVQGCRGDGETVLGDLDAGPEPAELLGQGGEPIGLLQAEVGRRRAAGTGRRREPPAHTASGWPRRTRAGRGRRRPAGPDPCTVSRLAVDRSQRQPNASSSSGSSRPGCSVSAGQPSSVTRPPVAAAAARKAEALDRSGSIDRSSADSGPGGHGPDVGGAVVDDGAALAQHRHRHPQVRRGRHRGPDVPDHDPACEPRRREQQAGDELARRRGVERDLAARARRRARSGRTASPRARRRRSRPRAARAPPAADAADAPASARRRRRAPVRRSARRQRAGGTARRCRRCRSRTDRQPALVRAVRPRLPGGDLPVAVRSGRRPSRRRPGGHPPSAACPGSASGAAAGCCPC